MKRFIVFLLLLPLTGLQSKSQEMKKFYVGTFTSEDSEGIYLCGFNSKTGDLSLEKTFKAVDNPSFLKVSPDNEKLYVVTRPAVEIEKSGGYVSAYRIQKDGSLQFLNKQVSHGADPCHVDVSPDGDFVAIATYGGGTTSLYPVKTDGSLQPASTTIVHQGSGADKSRQSAPHAHSVKFSPFSSAVFSADLGTDQLNIFELKNNTLQPATQQFAKMKPGAGPRHFDFHPAGDFIYVINELNSTITALKKQNQKWETLQTVSTLPDGYSEKSYCADIHVSKDGRFLYGSNRGHNSISVFKIDGSTGKLNFVSTVATEGEWPRNFALSPCGRFLLAANQHSNNISVFKILPEKGTLEFTGNELQIPSPVCIEFID
jgi:6-phosphogluconolactonase